jgi:YhcH/YjgK/YiaL family protein
MILDSLNHIENYKGLGNVYKALEFLKNTDFSKMEVGRYELSDDIYYLIQEYDCIERCVGEAHKKYIDVQYIFEGEEVMTVASIDCEKKLVEENPEKDVWFYSCESTPFLLKEGNFAVYFPNDIHMATVVPNKKTSVKKVVVKVKV